MTLKNILLKIKKFYEKHFAAKQKTFVYVALGDSTVEGIGATKPERSFPGIINNYLMHKYKAVEFYNLGKGHARARDIVENQLEKAISLNPDLITISIGANDVLRRSRLSSFDKNIEIILQRLKQETKSEVIINSIPDITQTPVAPKQFKHIGKLAIWRFNQRLKKQSQKANATLIDLFSLSAVYAKNYPEAFWEDGFHPSDFGYAIWANTIITHLEDIIKENNSFWDKLKSYF